MFIVQLIIRNDHELIWRHSFVALQRLLKSISIKKRKKKQCKNDADEKICTRCKWTRSGLEFWNFISLFPHPPPPHHHYYFSWIRSTTNKMKFQLKLNILCMPHQSCFNHDGKQNKMKWISVVFVSKFKRFTPKFIMSTIYHSLSLSLQISK